MLEHNCCFTCMPTHACTCSSHGAAAPPCINRYHCKVGIVHDALANHAQSAAHGVFSSCNCLCYSIAVCFALHMSPLPTISRTISIKGGKLKRQWQPKAIMNVDGRDYIELNKSDTGFNRFISGHIRGLPGSTCLTHIRRKRNLAMVNLDGSVDIDGKQMPGPTRHFFAKAKHALVDQKSTVEVSLPQVEYNREVAHATTMRILTTSDLNSSAMVELTAGNLHYVKLAMHAHQTANGTRKKSEVCAPSGSRWVKRGKQYGFLAKRPGTGPRSGRLSHKFFPTRGDVDAARAKTQAWLDGLDESDDDI